MTTPKKERPASPPSSGLSDDSARFATGTVLLNRYRIVALLGRGGMGEVYRADDLKLGQAVALKFLPVNFTQNADRIRRFHGEIKIARQVSHPHVCRVYDIGDVGGEPFLTMEYIPGENLKSLLRQVGRLPGDKAVELGRQLCLGLAAAHQMGVLHRDLKPQNVMIDSLGQVRLTDFGLAGFAGQIPENEIHAGTKTYQAPEQMAGKSVTIQSDLYSLGLVLYEMFSGQRAFPAKNAEELSDWHERAIPQKSLAQFADIDPAVERIILRCLRLDPAERPRSALEVAAAFQEDDPLAVALAAGRTPTPEMVINARVEGSLTPWIAFGLLAVSLLCLAAIMLLNDQIQLPRRVPPLRHPDFLAEDARRVLARLGFTEPPRASHFEYKEDENYVDFLQNHGPSQHRWQPLREDRPAAAQFLYVQSSRYLDPTRVQFQSIPGMIRPDNLQAEEGTIRLVLDPKGRLTELYAFPSPERETPPPERANKSPIPDWSDLFTAAELDPHNFRPAVTWWPPLVFADQRAAWDGELPEHPGWPVHVEAALFLGKPVYFQVLWPWSAPWRPPVAPAASDLRLKKIVELFLVFLTFFGGGILARHNARIGRLDRHGSFRLAVFLLAIYLLLWACSAKHAPVFELEMSLFWGGVGMAAYRTALVMIAYLALEPFVRRRWPWRIISWNRLLAGRFSDPLVGRDILIGASWGLLTRVLSQVRILIPGWIAGTPIAPENVDWPALTNAPYKVLYELSSAFEQALLWYVGLFFLIRVCRKEWLGVCVILALVMLNRFNPGDAYPWLLILFLLFHIGSAAFIGLRFGILAMTVGLFYFWTPPITYDLSAWYAGSSEAFVLLMAGLAIYGCYRSMGGRRIVPQIVEG